MQMRNLLFAAVLLAGCGASELEDGSAGDDDGSDGDDDGAGVPECFSASECPVGWTCTEFGVCVAPPSGTDGGVEEPPEVEYELGAPVSSRRFVWVTMADQDSIAKIDGATLAVTSIGVGDRPEVLIAMPGTDNAVVLDKVHGAATVVRPVDDIDTTEVEPTLPDLNSMVASPAGTYAVAYFDLAKAILEGDGGQVGSFQDVTVIAVEDGQSRTLDLTVGFRPREVEFDSGGQHAYVITDDGISVLDLPAVLEEGPAIVPPIAITDDPFSDTSNLEVDVAPSGELALVREQGLAGLRAVSLVGVTAGELWDVPLPGQPSDLELAPDGTRAYAVLRTEHQLAVIDLPADVYDPAGIELVDLSTATIGSMTLTADGHRGLLYTNATLDERLTVIELDQPGFPHRTFPMQKSVRAIGLDPTGQKALVLHARAPGDPDDAATFEEYIDRSWGYSVVDLATGFPKLQLTPVDPGAFAFVPDAPRAYLCLDGGDAEGAIAQVQEIELDTGVVRTRQLGSPPDAVGVLPDQDVVFVSQRHPLGRITFVDVATGGARTLTGFDLNSHVID
jgi:DNA-binding beta-propeller fold protein YncE